ncbi:replication endonuclease [Dickeya dianthicola]|uniref:replication endonuclease n=1 Tax=Dickeya dianthicola TaxID=204039 RepID=UPI00039C68EC|nr:replication endonuclease [Dickeya dianthicola]ATO33436.1 Phage replication protein [Dickeya dianthicola RNS04.9]MCA7005268.1 replication endonuclease [Dickeya dianthicola]MCI4032853.1 replication endonuclease [Dickeya dianthicola]MCI4156220.1 replication endonuclease [Dickeya dianthicola]MCI4175203.1 replication endonuclease [Dickeya dianthicola]
MTSDEAEKNADNRSNRWVYPWNAPRTAILPESSALSADTLQQGQAVLYRLALLPHFLAGHFRRRVDYLKQHQGLSVAFSYLLSVVQRRLWPRIDAVNARYRMNTALSSHFISEAEQYHQLPDMPDKVLRAFASRIAAHMNDAYHAHCEHYLQECLGLQECPDLQECPGDGQATLFSEEAQARIYGQLAALAQALNVAPAHWHRHQNGTLTLAQACAGIMRLVTPRWWERQLKIQRTRWREALWIAGGEVSRAASPFLSRQALQDIRYRRLATLDFLKSRELENTRNGERVDLIDKVMGSIANPDIRRMELMTMLAGIERYATAHQHIGMLVTLTAPGHYHPTRTRGHDQVLVNTGWMPDCPSPKMTQHYLVRLWGKIRTALKDRKLHIYGLRVVEPHHDGTPHWHMMLYCARAQRQAIVDILRRYAQPSESDRAAAHHRRFDCKHINKGGAAAYVAKYIAKNIDGYALDGESDHETGKPLKDMAAAASAWASLWRIPQFHFIGLPTVGAYRECRRIRSRSLQDALGEQAEAVRHAADRGDFAAYIEAQGGANVSRQCQSVRVARADSERLNAYDETIVRTVGIFSSQRGNACVFTTRPDEWQLVAKNHAGGGIADSRRPARPWSSVNNCGGVFSPGALPYRFRDIPRAPSARLTYFQRDRLASLRPRLSQQGIDTSRWEREALVRGARVKIDGQLIDEFRNNAISAVDEKRIMNTQVLYL